MTTLPYTPSIPLWLVLLALALWVGWTLARLWDARARCEVDTCNVTCHFCHRDFRAPLAAYADAVCPHCGGSHTVHFEPWLEPESAPPERRYPYAM